MDAQLTSELLHILTDIYQRFPHVIAASSPLQVTSLNSLIRILSTSRQAMRKRAISTLSALVSTSSKLFDSALRERIVEGIESGGDTGRIWVAVVASLARGQSALKVGALIAAGQVVEKVMRQTQNVGDIDAVEGALVVSIFTAGLSLAYGQQSGSRSACFALSCRNFPLYQSDCGEST